MQSVKSTNAHGQFEKIKKIVLKIGACAQRRQFTKSRLQLSTVRAQHKDGLAPNSVPSTAGSTWAS